MKSLRAQLAVGLSLGFLVLLGLGGAAVYVSTRTALLREFDAGLRVRADSLAALTEYEDGKVTIDLTDVRAPEYDGAAHAAYFEVWLDGGTKVAQSRSLGTADLPTHSGAMGKPAAWDLTLPNGKPGRAIALRFTPKISTDAASKPSPGPVPPTALVVVATERTNVNHHLHRLATGLLVIGVLVMGCSVVFTSVVVRRLLSPLARLAEQTAAINAASLHSRFTTAGLPAELAPVAERLNDLLSRLEQSFERERRFTADAAHELRTPIAELRSLAEVALKWPEDATATAEAFRDALAIAQRMEALVAGLLTLARYEAGKQPLASEPVSLAALATEIWTPLMESIRDKQITATIEIPGDFTVNTDGTLLRLIVTNLLTNAAEYTPRNGVVRIHAVQRDGTFTFNVTNTVTGLLTDDLPHLFERFWRKDVSRTGSEHSGLGLALAKACADALGMSLTTTMPDSDTVTVSLT